MEIMDRGASGAHVLKHVKKDSNQERVNVIHLLLSTVGRTAQEIRIKANFAMATFRAQVSIYAMQMVEIDSVPCIV